MLFNQFKKTFLVSAGLIAVFSQTTWGACIPGDNQGGNENLIRSTLASGKNAELCPKSTFKITKTLSLNFVNQQIYTTNGTSLADRAHLTISSSSIATAVNSYTSGTQIRNLKIDGGREVLGYLSGGGPLISIGGSVSNQVVSNVYAFHPRGWSIIHIFEGNLSCTGANITNNQIGPGGYSNGQWADGISLACRNSTVSNNVITDVTDGGIVIFGAPGSKIQSNTIISKSRTLLGGINLVDYQQYNGDNTSVVVQYNRIIASTAEIKVGIAIGPRVWVPTWTALNSYGQVLNNSIEGSKMRRAIAVDGVANYIVNGNTNSSSGDFVRTTDDSRVSNSILQCEFVEGNVAYDIGPFHPVEASNRNLVRQAYCMMLNRIPDALGLKTYESALNSYLSRDKFLLLLFNSAEFQTLTSANKLKNADFITMLYRVTLRREPDSNGFNLWLNQLNSGALSREQIFLYFTNSAEEKTKFPYL